METRWEMMRAGAYRGWEVICAGTSGNSHDVAVGQPQRSVRAGDYANMSSRRWRVDAIDLSLKVATVASWQCSRPWDTGLPRHWVVCWACSASWRSWCSIWSSCLKFLSREYTLTSSSSDWAPGVLSAVAQSRRSVLHTYTQTVDSTPCIGLCK